MNKYNVDVHKIMDFLKDGPKCIVELRGCLEVWSDPTLLWMKKIGLVETFRGENGLQFWKVSDAYLKVKRLAREAEAI